MNLYPWSLGGPLALYLGLYVVTLAIHVAFMGYVVGGTGYAAIAAVRGRKDPVADVLRDWLPFALGSAITAGVAPLLFLQMLEQESFYTANLLLFHRWMAVVPVLIVGFYLLYLHKSERVTRRLARVAVIGGAALCFGFVAWSWTENHLLSLDRPVWAAFYGARRWFYASPELAPRLATWLTAALPIVAVGASWQVRQVAGDEAARAAAQRRLAILALVGIAASTAAASWMYDATSRDARWDLDGPAVAPWWWMLGAARAAEAAAWLALAVRPGGARVRRWLASASAGGAIALIAGGMLREAARLHALEVLRPRAIVAGGALVFAIFALLTIAALVALYRIVRRGLREGPAR